MVRNELARLPAQKQEEFYEEYKRKAKSKGWMWVLWLVGWQFAYVREWGMQVIYWVSLWLVVGLVWWIVEAFKNNQRIRDYNKDVAVEVLRNAKTLTA